MKTVVITGASSGIGLDTAKLFAKNGFEVVNISRTPSPELSNNYLCDVSKEEEVKAAFDQIKQDYQQIDILINSAGYGISGATELISAVDTQQLFAVNVFGSLYCIRQALPMMKRGSKIINIGSAMAFFPVPFRGLYAASKAAINSITYSLRMECAPFGVQACTICPGDVKTNFTKNRVKKFETNDRYGERVKNATQGVDWKENKRMDPAKVSHAIYKQAIKNKTRPMTIVGGKYKLLHFLMRFFPLSLLLSVAGKVLGGFKPPKLKD